MKINKLPTGFLFTNQYSKGELETLSIGDYGREHNIKADFLGYSREINGVPNIQTKPISEKWVMTLSTQYGCRMNCRFCDCPKIKFDGNASYDDLIGQFELARNMFPSVMYTERLNIHFARMGEPALNYHNIADFCSIFLYEKKSIQERYDLRTEVIHPVFTTMLPKIQTLSEMTRILMHWTTEIKNHDFRGQAGLQLSINSTENEQRDYLFRNLSYSLEDISNICKNLPDPIGRKYCLNFAYASDSIIDGKKLANLFDPSKFMCKITPIHNNRACIENKIETVGGYTSYSPYKSVEEELKNAGFDVLVFIPSMDEENGLVTCGNLILSGTELKLDD